MNELTENEVAALATAGVVAIVTILTLAFVVIIQNKKIKKLTTPKIGFLGKSLALLFVLGLGVAMIGTVYISQNADTEVDQVSADREIMLQINTNLAGENANEYVFNAIPIVDGEAWGEFESFDFYWTITSEGQSSTEIEFGVTEENSGGITRVLQVGENTIKVTIFIESETYETETIITVE